LYYLLSVHFTSVEAAAEIVSVLKLQFIGNYFIGCRDKWLSHNNYFTLNVRKYLICVEDLMNVR